MTENRNNGGPAFPHSVKNWNDHIARAEDGMALRDWFAGQVLAGLLANPGGPFQRNDLSGWGLCNCSEDDVSAQAYAMADAMLATRSSSKEA